MSTDISTEIWNRAAMAGGGPAPRAGDTALSSALAFHNMVMSGGIDHAFDVLTTDEIIAASDGYRYLGLELIADLIGRAPAVLNEEDDEAIEELNSRYNELVPQDQTLVARFDSALQHSPEDFADLSADIRPTMPRWVRDPAELQTLHLLSVERTGAQRPWRHPRARPTLNACGPWPTWPRR